VLLSIQHGRRRLADSSVRRPKQRAGRERSRVEVSLNKSHARNRPGDYVTLNTIPVWPPRKGRIAILDPTTRPEVQVLRDACEELAADLRNLSTLIHSLRTALVRERLIKGSP
jgi:hypothetical protein